ncbi:MAG TPA: IPT/TIG domain-containing protein, partial [Geothrix sp.]|nr:IPT/TIG domain-containing protein [Geothrix sp.]
MVFRLPFVQRLVTSAFSVAVLLLVTACGGGGGGSSAYSLSVNPTSITFTAERDGTLPNVQSIHANFTGDGIIVGYPTGVTPPTWLSPTLVSSTSNSVTVSAQITTTALPAGNYATTLRFVTGKSDGTHLVTRDVPVTFRVSQGLKATQTAFTFAASEGAAPAAQTLNLSSDLVPYAWSLTVEPSGAGPTDWLTVSPSSGNASAPTAIQVQAASRPRGTYAANLVLRNGTGIVKATIPVAYTVNGVFGLAGTFSLNLNQGSATTALDVPMTLQTHLDSSAGAAQHWQITSDQPWLTVSPASGDLSANTSLTAHLNPALMGALPNGLSTATLTVHLTASSYSDLSVPFVLDLNLPKVGHVAPYTTWVGRTSPVILRGSGFLPAATVSVRFGTGVATGTVVSDTEIHVTAPSSMAASRLTVSIENALGIARTGADLLVLPQPGYTATSIDLPYGSRSLIQDPERQALLLVDGSSIQRIRFRNGAWSQDSLPLPSSSGIFVGLDGKDLFATAGNVGINDDLLRLDPETFATKEVKTINDYYESYSLVA